MPDKNTTVEIKGSALREFLESAKTNLTLHERIILYVVIPPAIAFTVACFVFAYYMAKLSNLI